MENIPDTPEGIILESLLEGLNQYYSAELSLKVKRGNRESRLKGNSLGGIRPFGYDIIDRKFVVNDKEAIVIKYVFKKYLAGLTMVEIAKRLHNRKIYYKDKLFTKENVKSILLREYYTGIYCCNDEYFHNLYPPIIDRESFKKVQYIRKHRMYNPSPGIIYILRYKLFCKDCGNPYFAEAGSSHLKKRYRYYKCKGRKLLNVCKEKIYKKELLEDYVTSAILEFLSDSKNIDNIANWIVERYKQNKNVDKLKQFLDEKSQCEKTLNNIQRYIEKGIYSATTNKKIKMLESRINELKAEIAIEESKESTKYSINYIKTFYRKAAILEGFEFVNYIIDKIYMDNKTMDIYLKLPYIDTFKDNKLINSFEHYKRYKVARKSIKISKKVSFYI